MVPDLQGWGSPTSHTSICVMVRRLPNSSVGSRMWFYWHGPKTKNYFFNWKNRTTVYLVTRWKEIWCTVVQTHCIFNLGITSLLALGHRVNVVIDNCHLYVNDWCIGHCYFIFDLVMVCLQYSSKVVFCSM